MTDVIYCPDIKQDGASAILISTITALLNLVMTLVDVWIKSGALREHSEIYALNNLSAKKNWVPFIAQIKERKIMHSIDFGLLEIPLPGITPKIGVFDVI